MLRKNEPVKFTRPDGVMKTVYGAVEQGCITRREIEDYTGLDSRRVKAAVYNLVFVGVICRQGKRHKSTYHLPDSHPQYRDGIFPNCFKGVRSVFDTANSSEAGRKALLSSHALCGIRNARAKGNKAQPFGQDLMRF